MMKDEVGVGVGVESEMIRGFGVTVEELRDAAEKRKTERGTSDKRICICGHPVSRHSEYAGRVSCTPTRMVCPCALTVPVIEVADTRPFLRKTYGSGPAHALLAGVGALFEKGRSWDWLPGFPACTKCDAEGVSVVPAAINRRGQISLEPEKHNVLLCEPCLEEITRLSPNPLKDAL